MSIRNPRLPLLPGYGTNPMVSELYFSYYTITLQGITIILHINVYNFLLQIGKKSFGVRPIFTTIGNVNMLIDKQEGVNRVPSLYCRKQAPDLPTWIMYDKHVSLDTKCCSYNEVRK